MHTGSCLCGTVQYEVRGELGDIILCHCTKCRKATGSAFASVAAVKVSEFRLISGQQALGEFCSSPSVYRVFCARCGSSLFSKRDAMPDIYRLRIGTVDTPIQAKPSMHIFTGSKAEWFDICDDAPEYKERP